MRIEPLPKTTLRRLIEFRHDLHRHPELSGFEQETAKRLTDYFAPFEPDRVLQGLGGAGVAFEFRGLDPGPTLLFRAELDALPLSEEGPRFHRSLRPGVSHSCGHDGHMAILAAVGHTLADQRPSRGRVILFFQPAEETGEGARAVLESSDFSELNPDFVFALHNIPGESLGTLILRNGEVCPASRGMAATFIGRASHAAEPHKGLSPLSGLRDWIRHLEHLPHEPGFFEPYPLISVVGIQMGGEDYGLIPAEARVSATLRANRDTVMEEMVLRSEHRARQIAEDQGLQVQLDYRDVFPSTLNHKKAFEIALAVADKGNLPCRLKSSPFPWSEDFGHFTARWPGALVGLGSGKFHRPLHHPAFDFPDELIAIGHRFLGELTRRILGEDPGSGEFTA